MNRLRPTQEWRAGFHVYLRTMPAYYAAPLRRVLTRMGAGNLANSLIPETMDNCLSYSVLNYLKRLKNQAKLEFDKTLSNNSSNGGSSQKNNPRSLEGMKVLARSPLKRDLLMNHLIKDKFLAVREQLTDFPGFQINIKDQLPPSNGFRNPYDIERKDLLDQIIRMRGNFDFCPTFDFVQYVIFLNIISRDLLKFSILFCSQLFTTFFQVFQINRWWYETYPTYFTNG